MRNKLLGAGTTTHIAKRVGEILFKKALKEADNALNSGTAIKRSQSQFNSDQVRDAYNQTLMQGNKLYQSGQLSGIVGPKGSFEHREKTDDFFHKLRETTKEIARTSMTDQEGAKQLKQRDIAVHGINGLSKEGLKKKREQREAKGEAAPSITESASKTNKKVNRDYGLNQRILYHDEKGNPHPTPPDRPVYEPPTPDEDSPANSPRP